MESLLSFGAESYVFQFSVQEYKDKDVHNYNFDLFCISVEFGRLH
jgi:hypothetical protein